MIQRTYSEQRRDHRVARRAHVAHTLHPEPPQIVRKYLRRRWQIPSVLQNHTQVGIEIDLIVSNMNGIYK